jgi:hypothetical protein
MVHLLIKTTWFLSTIEVTSGDMLDHCLGELYFNGGTMIPKSDGEINIRAPLISHF